MYYIQEGKDQMTHINIYLDVFFFCFFFTMFLHLKDNFVVSAQYCPSTPQILDDHKSNVDTAKL